jgi:hypothetical protein
MPASDTSKRVSVKITVQGQTEGQARPTIRAYLFDRADRLVHSEPVSDQSVEFDVAANQAYRVTVGPDLLTQGGAPANLVAQLAKARALSQDFLPTGPNSAELKINPNIWFCWFPTCINVHGTVTKQFSSGSASICNGTVQIFQVDLACTLDTFTVVDFALFKTRLAQKFALSAGVATEASSARVAAPANAQLSGGAAARLAAVPGASASSLSLADAGATVRALDGAALKQFVVANKAILFPFWCELIPDSAFCWQELTEVPIQSDGTFSAEICFWCPADYPDLYFEVIQNINGVDVEISDPEPIACTTYYNYDGSQSVDILVTDPRAIACLSTTGPGPSSLYVWPTAIGNYSLNLIDGLETLTGTGLLPGPTPFGGTLSLQLLFHPDLRANNIKYYRWWYQFDDESKPSVIYASVTHRYQTSYTPPFFIDSVVLGPKTIGTTPNLFEIPDPSLIWVDIDDPVDRPYAYFDSTEGAPPTRSGVNTANCSGTPGRTGMVTLILEMFDGSGNFVPCNNLRGASTLGDQPGDPAAPGVFGFILPQVGGPPNAYDFAPTPNVTDHGRLIFRVQIDNNVCVAELPKVATPINSTVTDPCGILKYTNSTDNVALSYVAFHPHNFLDWNLTVSLGIKGIVAGIPPSPPATNTSSGSPGFPAIFNNTAGALLGTCTEGAFAAVLYCQARATDGYDRLEQYDCQAVIAFALTEPCPPPKV